MRKKWYLQISKFRNLITLNEEIIIRWKCNNHTSKTADPTAHDNGLPPNVLNIKDFLRWLEISLVVTTAAKGKPFPMPLARVTINEGIKQYLKEIFNK